MERAHRVNNVRNANMTIEATTPKRGGGGGDLIIVMADGIGPIRSIGMTNVEVAIFVVTRIRKRHCAVYCTVHAYLLLHHLAYPQPYHLVYQMNVKRYLIKLPRVTKKI